MYLAATATSSIQDLFRCRLRDRRDWGGRGHRVGRDGSCQAEARAGVRAEFQGTADRMQPLGHAVQPRPVAVRATWMCRWCRYNGSRVTSTRRGACSVVADGQSKDLSVASEADATAFRARVADDVRDRLAQAPGKRRLRGRVERPGQQ